MRNSSRLLARFVGLVLAATLAVAATQLFTIGFETSPLFSEVRLASFQDRVTSRPAPATEILLGAALSLLAVGVLASLFSSPNPPSLRSRNSNGWTSVDRTSLADSLQRRLEAIDRRSNVNVTIDRRGRIDLNITTTDFSIDGPLTEIPAALASICEERSLPCQPGTVTIQPRTRAKRQHTIR